MAASPARRLRMNGTKSSHSILKHSKMEFRLHDELRLPPLVAVFEEITDIDRIKTICMSTLGAMMGSGNYRQYLYHMNNNVRPWCGAVPMQLHGMNVSNNADYKKKQMVERVIARALTSRTALLDINQLKEKSSKTKEIGPKPSQTKYKIEGLQESRKFDKYDREADQKYGHSSTLERPKRPELRIISPKFGRKDSVRPYEAKIPHNKMSIVSRELQLHKFTLGETVEESASDNDLAAITNVHLSQREQALKLLAEIQLKMEKRQKTDDEDDAGRKHSHPITPEEALQCAWLRLSKTQIATLEDMIKQQGKDPGIHAHSDVTNYDVFAEIREIRNREKILREEDEYRKH